MNAMDIMSVPVISIGPDTAVREIAGLLVRRNISGVPVVAGARVVGIVSAGDLLRRCEIETDRLPPQRPWWQRLAASAGSPVDYVKTHALRAKDIMTHPVIAVAETTPLAQVAATLAGRRIGRVPVLRDDRLVGIVTRIDLVRALQRIESAAPAGPQSDDAIRAQLLAELQRQPWWHPEWTAIWVSDGVVQYRGVVDNEAERRAARVAAERVPGVRAVIDRRVGFENWQPMV